MFPPNIRGTVSLKMKIQSLCCHPVTVKLKFVNRVFNSRNMGDDEINTELLNPLCTHLATKQLDCAVLAVSRTLINILCIFFGHVRSWPAIDFKSLGEG